MKRLLFGGLFLLLEACTNSAAPTPKVPLSSADLDSHQGIVIYGLSITGGQPNALGVYAGLKVYWMAYDPGTGKQIGKDTWEMSTGNGVFMAGDMENGNVGYRFLKLRPGDYAIAATTGRYANYFFVGGTLRLPRSGIGAPSMEPDVHVQAATPRFHVDAGDVIYIGDLDFDIGDHFELHWSLARNDAAARAFAATAGADAAARMMVRPVMHVDGTAIGKPDRLATVASELANQTGAEPSAPVPSPSDTIAAGAALNSFGLVGTWSPDCTKPLSDGGGRETYTVPASGPPTIYSETASARTSSTVLNAERVGDNQLHLITNITHMDFAADVTAAVLGRQYDQLFEKTDGKYRVMQSQIVNGDVVVKDGIEVMMPFRNATPAMAKCSGP